MPLYVLHLSTDVFRGQPVRPIRATRARTDENAPILAAKQNLIKSKKSAVGTGPKAVEGDVKAIEGGLKAAARRSVFTDARNKTANNVPGKENGKIFIGEKEYQKITAVTRPAQRNVSINQAAPLQQAGPRRVAPRKTQVYEDKKPSPKNNRIPKMFRDAVTKRDDQSQVAPRASNMRNQVPVRPVSRVKHQEIRDEPVYSDEQPHQFDGDYEDDTVAEDEENGSDAEGQVVDTKARFNADVEVISEDDGSADEEDNTAEYSVSHSRGAEDFTRATEDVTGVTAQIIMPKWNMKARKEIAELNAEFGTMIDEDELGDISMVAEYGDEIFEYMRELEKKLAPNANYMDFQSEIQWSMRAILMDWLVQVHSRFNLLPETLFLCANYVDRFLSAKVVSLGKLQLVGATALFVAAKYEEINCPSVHEVVYMVDKGYTAEEILKAERFMLSMLNFELGWPGPMSFLRRVSKADDYDLETRTLAKYFLEITVMDERFVATPPSFLAAGAHCLARRMLKKGAWTAAHTFYSGYTGDQLQPLIFTLLECCEDPKTHHASIYKKYSDRRYKRASLFVSQWMAGPDGPGANF
ncbi:cyclin-like protein [Tricharina praecox]|uniref:cyclin-like protein n=1 Tax=Tricharina praecox TaxID=43433 RepID=UPI00221FCD95|nr:cyclin-like protein [Tricharina praecox]KAI5845530.1 cyclin-like protein [Tricharina praecox]